MAGILRRDTVYGEETWFRDNDIINQIFNFDDQIIKHIAALMLSGSVFFIVHALMFFFFLYDEVVFVTEENDLNHEENVMEEGQNENTPLDTNKKDSEDEVNAGHEEIMEEGQNPKTPLDTDEKDKDEVKAS